MAPKLNPSLLIVAVNSLVALGAVGFLAYSKLVYKRPVITEHGERLRLEMNHASPAPISVPGSVVFDAITVNIEASPPAPRPADGTNQQIEGKYHYATVGFVLEIRDSEKKPQLEAVRALILDKFLSLVGRKNFRELTTVQGRYLLKTQLIDSVNQIVLERNPDMAKEPLVTNLFFSQFIVQ